MFFKNDRMQNSTKAAISGSCGIFLQYNITDMFSLRIDPGFEGWRYNYKDLMATDNNGNVIGTIQGHTTFDYITIPVLFKARFGGDKHNNNDGNIKAFVNAGPSFNVLLQQKTVFKGPDETHKSTNTDDFKTLNMGAVIGIGASIPLQDNIALSFELRNNFGLTNINKNTNENLGIRTNSTSLLVGLCYKFAPNR
ncbi:MAG: porin family protein [Cytophaga sp.]